MDIWKYYCLLVDICKYYCLLVDIRKHYCLLVDIWKYFCLLVDIWKYCLMSCMLCEVRVGRREALLFNQRNYYVGLQAMHFWFKQHKQ